MSCKNKCCWWPHNWLCLRGLYWTFVALFYVVIVVSIIMVVMVCKAPMLQGVAFWTTLAEVLIQAFAYALGLLTMAAILKALRKIVHAVAPCCCQAEEEKAEVVVTKQEDK